MNILEHQNENHLIHFLLFFEFYYKSFFDCIDYFRPVTSLGLSNNYVLFFSLGLLS